VPWILHCNFKVLESPVILCLLIKLPIFYCCSSNIDNPDMWTGALTHDFIFWRYIRKLFISIVCLRAYVCLSPFRRFSEDPSVQSWSGQLHVVFEHFTASAEESTVLPSHVQSQCVTSLDIYKAGTDYVLSFIRAWINKPLAYFTSLSVATLLRKSLWMRYWRRA
jgi:hypothetical protein